MTKQSTLDDIRGALTLALYYKQVNEIGAASIWLGLSCKIAQYLGRMRFSIRLINQGVIDTVQDSVLQKKKLEQAYGGKSIFLIG